MEWLWLVIGILIGAGVAWFWLEKKLAERQAAVETHYEGRLHHLQEEVARADQAHEETKVTLRDLLAERNAGNDRASAADAATATARRDADAAQRDRDRLQRELDAARTEAERLRARPAAATVEPPHDLPLVPVTPPAPPAPIDEAAQRLRAVDARLKMLPAGSSARAGLLAERNRLLAAEGGASAPPAATAASPALPPAPADTAPDDLEVIKGIGPRIHRQLEAMGIVTFAQLAVLSPEQIAFIEDKTGFPGRVGRERWIDQARELMQR